MTRNFFQKNYGNVKALHPSNKPTTMMNAENISKADMLDIIFDGRNKAYGAYELRKQYSKRLKIAISTMLGICLLAYVSSLWARGGKAQELGQIMFADTVTLTPPPEHKEAVPEPPPAAAAAQPEPLKTEQFTQFIIEPDDKVNIDEMPPELTELENALIGTADIDGNDAEGIVAPPLNAGTGAGIGNGIAGSGAGEGADETIFVSVENEAEYPGGMPAWVRYLERNLNYPGLAEDNGTQGEVKVQFIVDKEGNISEVEALNNPGDGLAEEAVRIIKKGGRWKPAEQNGRKVISRKIQMITFRLG